MQYRSSMTMPSCLARFDNEALARQKLLFCRIWSCQCRVSDIVFEKAEREAAISVCNEGVASFCLMGSSDENQSTSRRYLLPRRIGINVVNERPFRRLSHLFSSAAQCPARINRIYHASASTNFRDSSEISDGRHHQHARRKPSRCRGLHSMGREATANSMVASRKKLRPAAACVTEPPILTADEHFAAVCSARELIWWHEL